MTLSIVSNVGADRAVLQVVPAQDGMTALVASELRLQKEMEKAVLVQKKIQQEAAETIVALGQENARLKVSLVACEGSKKEIENLNKAKEKAAQEENEKLKEEINQLKAQAAGLMQQVNDLSKENAGLNEFYTLATARYGSQFTRERFLAGLKSGYFMFSAPNKYRMKAP